MPSGFYTNNLLNQGSEDVSLSQKIILARFLGLDIHRLFLYYLDSLFSFNLAYIAEKNVM
jgi:hypothetical protein